MLTRSAGAIIILLEVRSPTEQQKALVHQYASFMHSFLGRGVCEYMTERWRRVVVGILFVVRPTIPSGRRSSFVLRL